MVAWTGVVVGVGWTADEEDCAWAAFAVVPETSGGLRYTPMPSTLLRLVMIFSVGTKRVQPGRGDDSGKGHIQTERDKGFW